MSEVARLIDAVGRGESSAAAGLVPAVYEELRRLARGQMAHERAGHTLTATALVHEAYVRLLAGEGQGSASWRNQRHFFSAAAEAMRRILIDHARRKQAIRHGGGRDRVELSEREIPAIAPACAVDDLLALDQALQRLEEEDATKAKLVKMLYFAGLSLGEAAAALGISRTSAHRQWVFARAWLHRAMVQGADRCREAWSSPQNPS